MNKNEQETLEGIVKLIDRSRGDWRTLGGIARELHMPSERVTQIVKSHPDCFILPDDEPEKFDFLPNGFDAVTLTDNARNLYLQG